MKSAVMIGILVGMTMCMIVFFSGCGFINDNWYAFRKDIKAVYKKYAIQKDLFDAEIKISREREELLAQNVKLLAYQVDVLTAQFLNKEN